MQFTADTRNATAFELNALAKFVAELASVAPEKFAEGWTVQRAPSGAMLAEGNTPLTVAASPAQRLEALQAEIAEDLAADQVGNAAPGATAPAVSPAPPIPAAPGATSPAVAVAPESSAPPAVPAAPTPVPAAPALPSEAAASATQLDKAGCPWDARIHTGNKSTIGDGTWRKKPGVDPVFFEQIKAELMGNSPAPSAAIATAPAGSTASETSAPAAAPVIPQAPSAAPEATASAPAAPSLTGQDVIARCMEIQMASPEKGAALFQAIVGAGVTSGPMGLPGITDPAVLQAALEAVNNVAAQ